MRKGRLAGALGSWWCGRLPPLRGSFHFSGVYLRFRLRLHRGLLSGRPCRGLGLMALPGGIRSLEFGLTGRPAPRVSCWR